MTPRFCRNAAIAAAALLPLLAASAAGAQQISNTQSAMAYFDRLDQQKKGSFTLADMQRIETKDFQRTDVNRDGKLSLEEYLYGIPADRPDVIKRYTRRFQASDENRDGYVTLDEYMLFCVRVVAVADTNKDGIVTREEFMAVASSEGEGQ
ncbi:MAG: EF-hand domain-containing protein [Dongiaceae bacterium]